MFDYLLTSIANAKFINEPFKHICVESFLSQEHFNKLIADSQIKTVDYLSDENLVEGLYSQGWQPITFPGTFNANVDNYLAWRRGPKDKAYSNLCEGVGLTFRMMKPKSDFIQTLEAYLKSDVFMETLSDKFGIDYNKVRVEAGFQKYLSGYEISPHPDVRKKALTLMLNVNPHEDSEKWDHHTSYMSLIDERMYVQTFWQEKKAIDRCWVPWDWCKTVKEQRENNSLVIFAPGNDTLHAVKANYNDLKSQRTQFYANLWYVEDQGLERFNWEDFKSMK